MGKTITFFGLLLLLSGVARSQGYSQRETVYPMVEALRKQVNADKQKYHNVKLSETAYVPVVLNGRLALMDTLHTIQLKDVYSVSLDFKFDDLKLGPLGDQKYYGVIVIKTKDEEKN